MKKLIGLGLIILMLFTACEYNDTDVPDNNNDNQDEYSIEEFFPVIENTKYSYKGEGNEFASYTVFIDYISNNRFQTRTNNGGTETVKVYEFKDNQLIELYSRGEAYFREDFTNREFQEGNVVLKLPYTGELKQIVTSQGNFNAIEVITENDQGTNTNYYAKDVGLVKSIYKSDDYEVSSTLDNVEQNISLIQTVTLYYPDIDGVHLNSVDVQVSFNTNDSTKDVIEKTVKDLSVYELFSINTEINELYFDENDESVHIDLSNNFIEEMNAGSGFESLMLQSIANTLGSYYGVENIYLTVDGNLYESGHISLKENEPLKADYSIVNNQ
ncbi:GerMN domain-containing protein [Sedimentibacter hydroxybenzoicus DSM 7310]|uniref:GerMN domain-containing protein n=1 Tax=Sedimentibacter hydroxybenzoicus DSM 7310 TaxID=1123245 RepID=A0A974GXB8_SEDHY|nr:GerMN domain-containing protein [Sedimentibacter hydroxybenzoicus]NYB75051.1 GerMN domain-containing protein [Sedimentibacter hydroxybenzoicus DSM 7310]